LAKQSGCQLHFQEYKLNLQGAHTHCLRSFKIIRQKISTWLKVWNKSSSLIQKNKYNLRKKTKSPSSQTDNAVNYYCVRRHHPGGLTRSTLHTPVINIDTVSFINIIVRYDSLPFHTILILKPENFNLKPCVLYSPSVSPAQSSFVDHHIATEILNIFPTSRWQNRLARQTQINLCLARYFVSQYKCIEVFHHCCFLTLTPLLLDNLTSAICRIYNK